MNIGEANDICTLLHLLDGTLSRDIDPQDIHDVAARLAERAAKPLLMRIDVDTEGLTERLETLAWMDEVALDDRCPVCGSATCENEVAWRGGALRHVEVASVAWRGGALRHVEVASVAGGRV